MEHNEGDVISVRPTLAGNSCYLLIPPAWREYLGIKEDSLLAVKFDSGKHGRFIGFGKPNIREGEWKYLEKHASKKSKSGK